MPTIATQGIVMLGAKEEDVCAWENCSLDNIVLIFGNGLSWKIMSYCKQK